MLVIVVIVLVFTVLALGIYNLSLYKRIQSFQTQNRRFTNLNILQDFMNITGSDLSVDKKIKSINDIIIEKYQIKYSTIVVFDGTDYVVKASNVNSNHWDTLSKLYPDYLLDAADYFVIEMYTEEMLYSDDFEDLIIQFNLGMCRGIPALQNNITKEVIPIKLNEQRWYNPEDNYIIRFDPWLGYKQ